ncbi:hypothetical protein UFOVP1608_38 [uncultured Caudovirales phage]|uniref:Uncharacterized protein n=1 Tax=uncultured Caudovirales phage TaxID=2100421 RepID=A0A6J5SSQ9_9CAUD|nr:hypothetical protein UFOVP1608_38 [uncultured Caudovirales phage]
MSATQCVYCQEPLPPRGRSGPARRYCSGRCRQAASRDRAVAVEWDVWTGSTTADDPTIEELPEYLTSAHTATPEDQLAQAIVETRSLAEIYRRLALENGPNLAWRASRMADTLTAAVRRYFNGDPQ